MVSEPGTIKENALRITGQAEPPPSHEFWGRGNEATMTKTLMCLALASLLPVTACFGQSYYPVTRPGTERWVYAGCVNWQGGPTTCSGASIFTTAYLEGNGHTTAYHTFPIPSSWIREAYVEPRVFYKRLDNVTINGSQPIIIKAGQRGCMLSTGPVNNCNETTTSAFDIRQAIGNPEFISNCVGSTCANLDLGVVGYTPIYWVEEKPEYIHVGFTRQHVNSNSYNHWMQPTAAYGIWNATKDYISRHPEQGRMALNDMALPFGGLFDIAGLWRPSHWNHQYGTAVDVRARSANHPPLGEYSLPDDPALHDQFLDDCTNRGAIIAQRENTGKENQHIHCEWPNYN